MELKIRVQKIEDQMLYYDCKDSGLYTMLEINQGGSSCFLFS